MWRLRIRIVPHHFGKSDPVPHFRGESRIRISNRLVIQELCGLKMEPWRGHKKSQWSRGGPVCQCSKIFITLMRSRLRIGISLKDRIRIRIRIKVKSRIWFQICMLTAGSGSASKIRYTDPFEDSQGFDMQKQQKIYFCLELNLYSGNPWTMCRKFWLDLENLQLKFSPHSDGGAFCTTAGITSGRGTRSDRRRASFPFTVAIKKKSTGILLRFLFCKYM